MCSPRIDNHHVFCISIRRNYSRLTNSQLYTLINTHKTHDHDRPRTHTQLYILHQLVFFNLCFKIPLYQRLTTSSIGLTPMNTHAHSHLLAHAHSNIGVQHRTSSTPFIIVILQITSCTCIYGARIEFIKSIQKLPPPWVQYSLL